jgi:hypothetical protein
MFLNFRSELKKELDERSKKWVRESNVETRITQRETGGGRCSQIALCAVKEVIQNARK